MKYSIHHTVRLLHPVMSPHCYSSCFHGPSHCGSRKRIEEGWDKKGEEREREGGGGGEKEERRGERERVRKSKEGREDKDSKEGRKRSVGGRGSWNYMPCWKLQLLNTTHWKESIWLAPHNVFGVFTFYFNVILGPLPQGTCYEAHYYLIIWLYTCSYFQQTSNIPQNSHSRTNRWSSTSVGMAIFTPFLREDLFASYLLCYCKKTSCT